MPKMKPIAVKTMHGSVLPKKDMQPDAPYRHIYIYIDLQTKMCRCTHNKYILI